jgi:hypothetical protein
VLGRFLRLFNAYFQFRLSDRDSVTLSECYFGVAPRRSLFWSFTFFSCPDFIAVDPCSVQAAEIAEARHGWIGLKDEVVSGNLRVVWETSMAVVHAAENKGVVFCESKDSSGILPLEDSELDFGTHDASVAISSMLAPGVDPYS